MIKILLLSIYLIFIRNMYVISLAEYINITSTTFLVRKFHKFQ